MTGENCIMRNLLPYQIFVSLNQEKGMGGACGTYGGRTGACRILVGKPEGKRPRGRPWHRWEDDITMHVNLLAPEFYI